MDTSKLSLTLKQHMTVVLGLVLAALTGLLATIIWYVQVNSGPIAPTAPESLPQAAGNACVVQYGVFDRCRNLQFDQNPQQGEEVTFRCVGTEATDRYIFEYQTQPNVQPNRVESAKESITLRLGEYLNIQCTPCTDDYCAQPQQVAQDCSYTYSAQNIGTAQPECVSLTANTALRTGNRVQFTCEAKDAQNSDYTYIFLYQTEQGGVLRELQRGEGNVSRAVAVGEYLRVQCRPCIGQNCAPDTQVNSNCSLEYRSSRQNIQPIQPISSPRNLIESGDSPSGIITPDSPDFEVQGR